MSYDFLIFVSVDTLRSDCVGANPFKLWPTKYSSGRQPRTDVLDAIARDGAFFPNCISAAPYTSASHATIFTGKWPLRHGVYEFFNRRLASDTLFSEAKRLGYRTVFKVDFPIILGSFLGFDRDVDEYIVEDDARMLESLARGGPVAAFVHFGGVHIPYGFHNLAFGQDDYIAKVAELEKEVDPGYTLPGDQLVETYRSREDLDLLIRYKRVVQYHHESRHYDRLFELYLEGVEYFMRRRFEPFYERLAGLLKGKRYLLVLFGDHGEEYDDASFGHFNTLSEGVLRVPMIFSGTDVTPGLHRGRIRTADVAPTVLERIGVAAERVQALDGASLAATVWGGAPYPVRTAYAQSYISEVGEFVAFQKEMLRTGQKPGQLRHTRYKEAVYSGTEKLVRQTHAYNLADGTWRLQRCPARLALETFGEDGVPRPLEDSARVAVLMAEMDAYNAITPEKDEQAQVTDDIRGELRNMGYRIRSGARA